MPEPKFLGALRWGADEGCPCGGNRRVVYTKFHHGWFRDHARQTLTTALNPRGVFLGMSYQGFAASRDGSSLINPLTGIGSGKPWAFDPFGESLTGYTERSAHYSPSGALTWDAPYQFEDLSAGLDVIMADPAASIGWVPAGWTYEAGRAEFTDRQVLRGAIWSRWDPDAPAWIGDGPPDGSIRIEPDVHSDGVSFDGFHRVAAITSEFFWGDRLSRTRQEVGFAGFFSLQDSTTLLRLGGVENVIEGPRRWYYLESGTLTLTSPPIAQAHAEAVDRGVRIIRMLRVGDVPADGTPYETVTGVSAGGVC